MAKALLLGAFYPVFIPAQLVRVAAHQPVQPHTVLHYFQYITPPPPPRQVASWCITRWGAKAVTTVQNLGQAICLFLIPASARLGPAGIAAAVAAVGLFQVLRLS
jgi:hypothetical protein